MDGGFTFGVFEGHSIFYGFSLRAHSFTSCLPKLTSFFSFSFIIENSAHMFLFFSGKIYVLKMKNIIFLCIPLILQHDILSRIFLFFATVVLLADCYLRLTCALVSLGSWNTRIWFPVPTQHRLFKIAAGDWWTW